MSAVRESRATLVYPGLRAHQAHQAHRDPREPLDLRVRQHPNSLPERLAPREQRPPRQSKANKDPRVRRAPKDLQGCVDLLGLRGRQGFESAPCSFL